MANITGTEGNDTLIGGDGNDDIFGNGGNDTLLGGAGSDLLNGGDGADILTGGAGNDTLQGSTFVYGDDATDIAIFSGNRSEYQIVARTVEGNTTYTVTDLRTGSPDGQDLLRGIEIFRFADRDASVSEIGEVIVGNGNNRNLSGTPGPDRFLGSDLSDTIYGQAGDDEIAGGSGNDYISGGAGTDTTIYSGNRSDYTFTQFAGGAMQITDNRSGSPDGTDTLLRDVENLRFVDQTVVISTDGITSLGTSGNDTVVGGAGNDNLNGGDGDDSLIGGAGSDSLYGGLGSDTLTGGAGNDVLNGGLRPGLTGETDIAVYSGNRSDYRFVRDLTQTYTMGYYGETFQVLDLRASSPDGHDLVTNITTFRFADGDIAASAIGAIVYAEPLIYSGLFGTDGNDQIFGGSRSEELTGRDGDDELSGGAGNDTINGGAGTDTAIFSGNYRNYTVTLLAGGEVDVRDNRTGSPDGTDRISRDVELLRFADGTVAPGGSIPFRDARSDFNGDGRSDVAWLHTSGLFTSWDANSDGSFLNKNGSGANTLGTDWKIVGIGDFNGDGIDDLLWRHSSGLIGQWQGQATGAFVNTSNVAANAVDNSWSVAGVADYNGDGRDDILWRHTSGAITEWLAQPGGSFTNNSAAAANVVDTSWQVVASGDFDADGRADVLWQHSSGEFAEWRGSATGALVNVGKVMAGAVGTVIGSADFNGDGRDDILIRAADGSITEWLAQASGQFTALTPALQARDLNWDIVGIGDYNGDGFNDLLWRHTSGEFGQWLGSASGQFTHNDIIPTIDPSWQTQSPDIFLI